MASAERNAEFDVGLESFYKALVDFEAYPDFVSGVKSARVIEKTSEGGSEKLKVAFHVEMMKSLNYELLLEHSMSVDKSQAQMKWTLSSSDFFKTNNGAWQLRSLGEGRCDVTYSLDIEFNFSVPSLILRGLVKKALPQAMDDFYKKAKSYA